MPKNISKITTAVLERTTYIFIPFSLITFLVHCHINARFSSNDLFLQIAKKIFYVPTFWCDYTPSSDLFLGLTLIFEALVQYCRKNPEGLNKNTLQEKLALWLTFAELAYTITILLKSCFSVKILKFCKPSTNRELWYSVYYVPQQSPVTFTSPNSHQFNCSVTFGTVNLSSFVKHSSFTSRILFSSGSPPTGSTTTGYLFLVFTSKPLTTIEDSRAQGSNFSSAPPAFIPQIYAVQYCRHQPHFRYSIVTCDQWRLF